MWLNFMNLFPPQKINFWGLILNAQHTQVELQLISFFGLSYFGDSMVCFFSAADLSWRHGRWLLIN